MKFGSWSADREFERADINWVADFMAPKTADEVRLMSPGLTLREILQESIDLSGTSFLMRYRSEPFGFLGLAHHGTYDIGWFVSTRLIYENRLGFVRAAKQFYEPYLACCRKANRIVQVIQRSYVESIRFFEFLGYQQLGVVPVNGEPFTLVAKEFKPWAPSDQGQGSQ